MVKGDLGRTMMMAEKADVWMAKGKGTKWGKIAKSWGKWVQKTGTTKFQNKQKAGMGAKRFWECSPRKRDYTVMEEPNFGSISAVTMGTSTQGNQGGKDGGGNKIFPCMACGGKQKFKECLDWKKVQALIKDDKNKGN